MALNKSILQKLAEKTKNDDSMKEFLLSILQFESETKGWYEKDYIKILEEHCEVSSSEI